MKRTLTLLVTLLIMSISLQAQKMFELPLWQGAQLKDDAADARVFVYLPQNPTGQAIVICPGGGYGSVVIDNEGHSFAPWLNANGIALIVLKYRLPKQRYLIPMTDAQQALRLVRSHAKEWGIDAGNVGIMGSSAGGHLASTVATHFDSKETRPDFQVLLYPVITMDPTFTNEGTHNNLLGEKPDKALEVKFSNEKQVTDNTPRAFIVVSAADKIVEVKNSLVYTEALIEHKVPVSLHVYPGGYHGFGFNNSGNFKDAEIWHTEFLRWLKNKGDN